MSITHNKYDFDGKVVIVTGCARGIGRAIARAFAENGAKVAGADLNVDGVRETLAGYPDCTAYSCNIADEEACKDLVDKVVEHYGRLDVLMNNAGIFCQAPVTQMSAADWHKMFSVNVDSLFYLTKYAMPHLLKTKGNVVQTASVNGLGGDYMSWAYNATKHAVVGMVRSLCIDYGPQGVRINAVAPAMTATDMNRSVWTVPEKVAPFIERIPMAASRHPTARRPASTTRSSRLGVELRRIAFAERGCPGLSGGGPSRLLRREALAIRGRRLAQLRHKQPVERICAREAHA